MRAKKTDIKLLNGLPASIVSIFKHTLEKCYDHHRRLTVDHALKHEGQKDLRTWLDKFLVIKDYITYRNIKKTKRRWEVDTRK